MSGGHIAVKRHLQRVWYLASSIVVTIVLVCAILLVALRLFGLKLFTVTSGSMEPNYPVGSLVYSTPINASEIKVGDVITFMNSKDTVVTHRVSEVITETSTSGTTVTKFRTKGDANEFADNKLVHEKNVIGTPVAVIPLLGYVSYYLQRPPGLYIALIIGTFLVTLIIIPYIIKPKGKEQTAEVNI